VDASSRSEPSAARPVTVLRGRAAELAATFVAAGGFLYSAAFVTTQATDARAPRFVTALLLLVVGLGAVAVMASLYLRLRNTDEGVALIALVFGVAGAVGSAIHGGFDLANVVNAPEIEGFKGVVRGPNAVDPRGLMTFGVAAVTVALWSWLILRAREWDRRLASLGYLSAVLLLVIYLGRLIALDPSNPILLLPALVEGFVVNPAWFAWVGRSFARESG
jgi:hypothetical protein